jgi:hypothetical protein
MATAAYSSAGAGFGTNTSGAAWAPVCPATVDAGDILIAHISCRDLVTNVVVPAGWTELDHARSSTAGRAWVFGKIADGTEDGAAISFGTQAVNVNRSGRIYRFTGNDWTGQDVGLVVTGWTATSGTGSTINDVGITTASDSCLALHFIKIDDNNTLGDFTGETGGNWVEAVAEYSNNLTTGVTLQLQTAAMPTAGTIDGGTVVQSAADPWVITGCYIREPIIIRSGTVVITGNGYVFATAAHDYIEGVLLSGGGAPTATGNRVVNNRNGTLIIAEGGDLTATGAKVSSVGNAVVTGGGSIVATYSVSIVGANVVVTGGGTPAVRTSTTGTVIGVRISGGGLVTANIVPASGSIVIHGGGSIVTTGQGLRVAIISGGGSIVVTRSTTGLLSGVVISGGGTLKVNVKEGTASISGGGSPVVVVSKGVSTARTLNHRAVAGLVYLFGDANSALVIHGGGTLTATGVAGKGIASIQGGGALTATGSKAVSRNVIVTGGGSVVATSTTSTASTAAISGGGNIVTTYTRSSAIGANLVAQYDLRALASQDLLSMYDLLEFGTAGANLLVSYDLRALVSELLEAQYDLRVWISKDLVGLYDVRNTTPPVYLVSQYDLTELAGEDLIVQYVVISRRRKDFIAVYDVKPLIEDTSKAYAVLSRR